MSSLIEVKSVGTIKINGVEYNNATIVAAYQQIIAHLGLKVEKVPVAQIEGYNYE